MLRVISIEGLERAMKQVELLYRPPQILELKERIDGEIRAAGVRASVTGVIDDAQVQQIVGLKLELDGLYGAWAEGELR